MIDTYIKIGKVLAEMSRYKKETAGKAATDIVKTAGGKRSISQVDRAIKGSGKSSHEKKVSKLAQSTGLTPKSAARRLSKAKK